MTANATPIGRIMLRDVRLSFAQGLFEASTIPGADANAKPKFNCGLLLPPDHPQINDVREKMKAVAREYPKWKGNGKDGKPIWQGIYAALEKADKLALHDGDGKPSYDGYPGNFYISPSAAENAPPTLLDQAKTQLSAKDAAKLIYSGCYVNASIELWAQDNGFGKRINAQLRGVQFLRKGDTFSAGRPADTDEFEEVTEGADAGDFGTDLA